LVKRPKFYHQINFDPFKNRLDFHHRAGGGRDADRGATDHRILRRSLLRRVANVHRRDIRHQNQRVAQLLLPVDGGYGHFVLIRTWCIHPHHVVSSDAKE